MTQLWLILTHFASFVSLCLEPAIVVMFLFPCLHTIVPASWWFQKPKFWGLLHPVAVLQNGNEENAAHLHRQDWSRLKQIEADWNILEIVPLKIYKSHVMLQLQELANSFGMFWIFNIQPSAILGPARTTDRTMRRFVTELHRKYEETGKNMQKHAETRQETKQETTWFDSDSSYTQEHQNPFHNEAHAAVVCHSTPGPHRFDLIAISVSWQARAA